MHRNSFKILTILLASGMMISSNALAQGQQQFNIITPNTSSSTTGSSAKIDRPIAPSPLTIKPAQVPNTPTRQSRTIQPNSFSSGGDGFVFGGQDRVITQPGGTNVFLPDQVFRSQAEALQFQQSQPVQDNGNAAALSQLLQQSRQDFQQVESQITAEFTRNNPILLEDGPDLSQLDLTGSGAGLGSTPNIPTPREIATLQNRLNLPINSDVSPLDIQTAYVNLVSTGAIANVPFNQLSGRDLETLRSASIQASQTNQTGGFTANPRQRAAPADSSSSTIPGIPGGFGASQGSLGFGGNNTVTSGAGSNRGAGGAAGSGLGGAASGAAQSAIQGITQPGVAAPSASGGIDPLLRQIPRPELNVVYSDMLRSGSISRSRIDQLNQVDVRSIYDEWRRRDRFDRGSLGR